MYLPKLNLYVSILIITISMNNIIFLSDNFILMPTKAYLHLLLPSPPPPPSPPYTHTHLPPTLFTLLSLCTCVGLLCPQLFDLYSQLSLWVIVITSPRLYKYSLLMNLIRPVARSLRRGVRIS